MRPHRVADATSVLVACVVFAEVDRDGSGYITFDELYTTIRQHVSKGPKTLSDNAIKALWCALDVDDSNALQKDEMAGFFKLGAPAVHKRASRQASKGHSSTDAMSHIERRAMNRAIESTSTSEMRAELAAAGVALPEGDELTKLSRKLNEWLNEKRVTDGKDHSHTWFNRTLPPTAHRHTCHGY